MSKCCDNEVVEPSRVREGQRERETHSLVQSLAQIHQSRVAEISRRGKGDVKVWREPMSISQDASAVLGHTIQPNRRLLRVGAASNAGSARRIDRHDILGANVNVEPLKRQVRRLGIEAFSTGPRPSLLLGCGAVVHVHQQLLVVQKLVHRHQVLLERSLRPAPKVVVAVATAWLARAPIRGLATATPPSRRPGALHSTAGSHERGVLNSSAKKSPLVETWIPPRVLQHRVF